MDNAAPPSMVMLEISLLQDSLLYTPLLKCSLFVCENNALCFFCSFFAQIIVVSMCHQSSLLVSIYAWVLARSPYHQSSLLLFVYAQFAYVASCNCHSLHLLFCQNFLLLFISPKLYVVVCLCCLCCFVVITHYAFSFAKILYCCLFVHDLLMLICSCYSLHLFFICFCFFLKMFGLLCYVLVCYLCNHMYMTKLNMLFYLFALFFLVKIIQDFFYNNFNNQNILKNILHGVHSQKNHLQSYSPNLIKMLFFAWCFHYMFFLV